MAALTPNERGAQGGFDGSEFTVSNMDSDEICEMKGHETRVVAEDETGATHECVICGAEIIE